MNKQLQIGIIKETKNPPDRRVPITPSQIDIIQTRFPNVKICVEPSDLRCYKNEEYNNLNVDLNCRIEDCDILMGVKEVKIDNLIPNKKVTYL